MYNIECLSKRFLTRFAPCGLRGCIASLFYYVLLCICVVSCPYGTYFPTVIARCSLFVLKVPLNPKQTNILIRFNF